MKSTVANALAVLSTAAVVAVSACGTEREFAVIRRDAIARRQAAAARPTDVASEQQITDPAQECAIYNYPPVASLVSPCRQNPSLALVFVGPNERAQLSSSSSRSNSKPKQCIFGTELRADMGAFDSSRKRCSRRSGKSPTSREFGSRQPLPRMAASLALLGHSLVIERCRARLADSSPGLAILTEPPTRKPSRCSSP